MQSWYVKPELGDYIADQLFDGPAEGVICREVLQGPLRGVAICLNDMSDRCCSANR
jgi:hypothetical protein